MNSPFKIGENTVRGLVLGTILGSVLLAGLEKLATVYEESLMPVSAVPGASVDPHPFLLWELPPGETLVNGQSISVNSVGARGPEVSPIKADNERRILFLGDGVAFGEGVERDNTFGMKSLEALGGDRVGIEGILLAVPDYTILQHRNLMHMRGWSLNPDLLIVTGPGAEMSVSAYVDKDVISNFRSTEPTRAQLEEYALFRVLDQLMRVQRGQTAIVRQQVFKAGVQTNRAGKPRVGTNLFARTLDLLTKEAIERDVDVIFVIPPLPADLNDSHFTDSVHLYRTAFVSVAEHHGVPIVDGAAVFKKSGRPAIQLFEGPRMLTEYGHRILGYALSKKLQPWMRGRRLIGQGTGGTLPAMAEPEPLLGNQ